MNQLKIFQFTKIMVEIEMKQGYGVIYIMTCIPTGKSYIGQALNYTSCGIKYSGKGRVEMHFREAFYKKRTHCRILNEAIREYGIKSFIWCNLKEVPEKDLDQWENYYVESYNTLKPNGYNFKKGGDHFTFSDETAKRMIKNYVQKESERCPKYIHPIFDGMHVRGYSVEDYPNVCGGVYPKQNFNSSGHNNRNLAFAKKYIRQLETINSDYVFDDTTHPVPEILKNKINAQTGLPKTIYRVNCNKKHIGYEILGFKTKDGKSVYKKFNDSKIPLKEKYEKILKYLEELIINNMS